MHFRGSNLARAALATVALSVAAGAAGALPALARIPAPWSAVVIAAVVALFAGILFIPPARRLDRAISGLRRSRDDAGSPVDRDGLGGLHRAIADVLDGHRQREHDLRSRLKDLEVRHRVAETGRRRIETVLNALRDVVIVTDPFDEVVMANRSAAETLGFALEHARNEPLDRLVADERLRDLIAEARLHGRPRECRRVEHQMTVHADHGRAEAVFDVALACVEDHKHDVAGVVTILHDMTHERELAALKSDFVSKASHELRTPLSSIRAYVEMLVDDEADDETTRRDFYRIIQSEAERLGRLIDNLLDISQIESGRVALDAAPVGVDALVERAVGTIAPQARARDIAIETTIARTGLIVEGDADQLHQVLLNLLSNAVKYTSPGGSVTVAVEPRELSGGIELSVADSGVGIPPEDLPRLFDKFYRVEKTKHVASGSGLGLSLCRHIVETVHRGRIDVESRIGVGTRFRVLLPARQPRPAGAGASTGGV